MKIEWHAFSPYSWCMDLYDIDFCCMELYDKHFRCMEVNPGLDTKIFGSDFRVFLYVVLVFKNFHPVTQFFFDFWSEILDI